MAKSGPRAEPWTAAQGHYALTVATRDSLAWWVVEQDTDRRFLASMTLISHAIRASVNVVGEWEIGQLEGDWGPGLFPDKDSMR